jgi:hypothetical protein
MWMSIFLQKHCHPYTIAHQGYVGQIDTAATANHADGVMSTDLALAPTLGIFEGKISGRGTPAPDAQMYSYYKFAQSTDERRRQELNDCSEKKKDSVKGDRPCIALYATPGAARLSLFMPAGPNENSLHDSWTKGMSPKPSATGHVQILICDVVLNRHTMAKIAATIRFYLDIMAEIGATFETRPDLGATGPCPLPHHVHVKSYNQNVHVIRPSGKEDENWVCKEYCYSMRADDQENRSVTTKLDPVDPKAQRQCPSQELLNILGQADDRYNKWQRIESVINDEEGDKGPLKAPHAVVLKYPHVEGMHRPTSKDQVLHILHIIRVLHDAGYVHGDILPRNIICPGGDERPLIIDFDFTQKVSESYFGNEIEIIILGGDGDDDGCSSSSWCSSYNNDCCLLINYYCCFESLKIDLLLAVKWLRNLLFKYSQCHVCTTKLYMHMKFSTYLRKITYKCFVHLLFF